MDERKEETSSLWVSFPVKIGAESFPQLGQRDVKARVTLMDQDTVFEGMMKKARIAVGNGRWTTDRYKLSLAPRVGIGHIHSVIVWIGTEKYEFSTF